jgi:hypothetical protein
MQSLPIQSRITAWNLVVLLLCLSLCFLIPAIGAADVDIEAYMGETLTLHGTSYVGDSVYLFMTGPNLPANGVTLTDTSMRADQGHFTIVNVDDNQEWTYIWKTSRIEPQIDPGTYIVYVTNQQADLSDLGGSSSYKTLSVFLKDSGATKVSIDAAHSYTLNPEDHTSTPIPAPSMNITNETPAVISPVPSPDIPLSPEQTVAPTTRAGTGPWAAVTALLFCVCLVLLPKARP